MDDDILKEFLSESWENLSQLDLEIVALEKKPDDSELLGSIFRTIHTIKGTCGFIGLVELGSVAHAAENVLDMMRSGKIEISAGSISLILQAVDVIKELLEGIEATNAEPAMDNQLLISQLDQLAATGEILHLELSDELSPSQSDTADTRAEVADSVAETQPQQMTKNPIPAAQLPDDSQPDNSAHREQCPSDSESSNLSEEQLSEDSPEISTQDPESYPAEKKSVTDLSVRINVDVLDNLMNLVSELVLTRNQLIQLVRNYEDSIYSPPINQLNRITTELQEGVMQTRMQPIGNAWKKLPRLVRDLCQITGRQIELVMSGADTELDRTVLDAIKDPLTHMVRNSADHGIEPPELRRQAGKKETGVLSITAYHEGGQVVISIQDDGAGINTQRVLSKALENGIITSLDAANMTEQEINSLIFSPGFTTSEEINSISGRGVGMDVVKTQIEKIGGSVELISKPSKGTTILIKIPLTLAIVSALIVRSANETFAIPQFGVTELVSLSADEKHQRIDMVHNQEVLRLRNNLLPLVHLDKTLKIDHQSDTQQEDLTIVVVQVGNEPLGIVVSEVYDTEDIVVKPVGSLLKHLDIYQGTTILGDGRVVMILDIAGIWSGLGERTSQSHLQQIETSSQTEIKPPTSMLLFETGGTTLSVPLALVSRLEEFPQQAIEHNGNRQVVQYRNKLLPLIEIDGTIPNATRNEQQSVIVFSEGDLAVGIMVDKINDIVEEYLDIQLQSNRPGILGSAIINGKAVDVIDTQYYILNLLPNWFNPQSNHADEHVLLIDKSLFFRQLATTALEAAGYQVTAVDNAIDAIEKVEGGATFDVMISESDLPMMNGYEFCDWFRTQPNATIVPCINLAAESEIDALQALDAGFHQSLPKFNAQELITTIKELCRQLKPNKASV